MDKGEKVIISPFAKNFGFKNDILWWVSIKQEQITLIYYINSSFYQATFGDVDLEDILDVSIQNQIVLVTTKGKYNGFESVWFAELQDFVFTKVSTHIIGVDLDDEIINVLIDKIHFNTAMVERLAGIIFISYIIENRDKSIQKHTVISYNYGNSFLPLKYKTNDGLCEMVDIVFKSA
ncbi:hypothetical protein RF11_04373 [Thelohanellus kitauei]|uniref:Uncharacterized protein n=1 Tax=Thelohanellus kitauei TaxID=669202 RepID=A0A0C2MF33_THEKT|nr:hypothetical protein RF11_04373 [Thelohanellus kitauei]